MCQQSLRSNEVSTHLSLPIPQICRYLSDTVIPIVSHRSKALYLSCVTFRTNSHWEMVTCQWFLSALNRTRCEKSPSYKASGKVYYGTCSGTKIKPLLRTPVKLRHSQAAIYIETCSKARSSTTAKLRCAALVRATVC
jgi:hypothetical protein